MASLLELRQLGAVDTSCHRIPWLCGNVVLRDRSLPTAGLSVCLHIVQIIVKRITITVLHSLSDLLYKTYPVRVSSQEYERLRSKNRNSRASESGPNTEIDLKTIHPHSQYCVFGRNLARYLASPRIITKLSNVMRYIAA